MLNLTLSNQSAAFLFLLLLLLFGGDLAVSYTVQGEGWVRLGHLRHVFALVRMRDLENVVHQILHSAVHLGTSFKVFDFERGSQLFPVFPIDLPLSFLVVLIYFSQI